MRCTDGGRGEDEEEGKAKAKSPPSPLRSSFHLGCVRSVEPPAASGAVRALSYKCGVVLRPLVYCDGADGVVVVVEV
jgi:hypothetical protein